MGSRGFRPPNYGGPDFPARRTQFDQIILPDISVPLEQEIISRAPSQSMGGEPLLITSTVLASIFTRLRESSFPIPDHFEPGLFPGVISRGCQNDSGHYTPDGFIQLGRSSFDALQIAFSVGSALRAANRKLRIPPQ